MRPLVHHKVNTSHLKFSATPGPTTPTHDTPVHLSDDGEMNMIVSDPLRKINNTISHLGRARSTTTRCHQFHLPTNTRALVYPSLHTTKSTGIPPEFPNGIHPLFGLLPHFWVIPPVPAHLHQLMTCQSTSLTSTH